MILFLILFNISQASVLKYNVTLEPDFKNKSIVGNTEIIFSEKEKDFEFPLSEIVIDKVLVDGKSSKFTADRMLKISGSGKRVLVNYHGSPLKGLVWGEGYVYTDYEPCTWMICYAEPGLRAEMNLKLIIPKEMNFVVSGSGAYSSYLYGFAAGNFVREVAGPLFMKWRISGGEIYSRVKPGHISG